MREYDIVAKKGGTTILDTIEAKDYDEAWEKAIKLYNGYTIKSVQEVNPYGRWWTNMTFQEYVSSHTNYKQYLSF